MKFYMFLMAFVIGYIFMYTYSALTIFREIKVIGIIAIQVLVCTYVILAYRLQNTKANTKGTKR